MGQPAIPLIQQEPASASVPVPDSDPTYYPTEDEMGESALQTLITELLRPLIARWLAHRHIDAFVGADQFIYWIQHAPTVSVAPDIYILPGVSPNIVPGCWKVWETGIAPVFALEVMAEDNSKDLLRSPDRYDSLGVMELLMFDPFAERRKAPVRFWSYRRNTKGRLMATEATMGDRIRSVTLDCHVRVVGRGDMQRLRLGTGAKGNTLFPTEAEAQEMVAYQQRVEAGQVRARAKAAEARAEQERERAEQERERAEQAEAQAEQERERAEQERERAAAAEARAEQERQRAAAAETEMEQLRALLKQLQK